MTQSTASRPTSDGGRSSIPLVIGVVLVVVLVAAIVTILLVGGDDDSAPAGSPPATAPVDDPQLPPGLAGEVREVEVEGDPLPPYPAEGPDPAIGMRPPLLAAEDAGGSVYTISPDIAGPVMVVFLAHWCPACNDEIPHLVSLERDGRLPDDLQVFGVLTAMAADRPNFPPSRWVVDRGWTWPAVADGIDFGVDPPQWAAADAYGLTAYPYTVLVDDGVVVDRWSGGLGPAGLEARIAAGVG